MMDHLSHGPLRLDAFTPDDAEALHAIFSDPATHTIGDGPYESVEATRGWLHRRDLQRQEDGVTWYGIRNESGVLIGNAGVFMGRTNPFPELGFMVRATDQGHGVGSAAAAAVVAEAHRAGFMEVWATIRDWNVASLRAVDRIGFEENRREVDDRGQLLFLRHVIS